MFDRALLPLTDFRVGVVPQNMMERCDRVPQAYPFPQRCGWLIMTFHSVLAPLILLLSITDATLLRTYISVTVSLVR